MSGEERNGAGVGLSGRALNVLLPGRTVPRSPSKGPRSPLGALARGGTSPTTRDPRSCPRRRACSGRGAPPARAGGLGPARRARPLPAPLLVGPPEPADGPAHRGDRNARTPRSRSQSSRCSSSVASGCSSSWRHSPRRSSALVPPMRGLIPGLLSGAAEPVSRRRLSHRLSASQGRRRRRSRPPSWACRGPRRRASFPRGHANRSSCRAASYGIAYLASCCSGSISTQSFAPRP